MSYHNIINFGDIIREYNRKQSQAWKEINEYCRKKNLEQEQLIREAINHISQEYREMLKSPNTPEGIKALALLQKVMLELAKGMA